MLQSGRTMSAKPKSRPRPALPEPYRLLFQVLVLLLLPLVAYIPAIRGGFIWDDNLHVTAQPAAWTGEIAGMGFADTVMAGRLGTRDLAAVAVGSSVWMVVFLFGLGVLMAMSPTAAHAFGAGRDADVGVYTRQCLWLSQALAAGLMLVLHRAGAVLTAVGVDPSVIPLTSGYLGAIAWGLATMMPAIVDKLIIVNLPHLANLLRELRCNPQQHENSQYARNFQQPDSHEKLDAAVLDAYGWPRDSRDEEILERLRRFSMTC